MARTRSWLLPLFSYIRDGLVSLITHPLRASFLGLVGAALVWLVLTSSLPFVLAKETPEAALFWNPNHPVALLAKAKRLRKELLGLSTVDTAQTVSTDADGKNRGEHPARFAAPRLTMSKTAARKDEIREEIRSLVTRVVKNDPLNATAFRMLGEVTDDPTRVRALMQAAVKRSRREATALFWLLNDSYVRKDWASVLKHADILLRAKRRLTRYVVGYLGRMADDAEGRLLLQKMLIEEPSWRARFFNALPRHVSNGDTPLKLMIGLKEAGSTPTNKEITSYLNFLIGKYRVDLAYNVWLQLLPDEQLASVGLLQNADFERDPTGTPFDWRIATPRNATIDFVNLDEKHPGRALRISFGVGRVKFPGVTQTVYLGPGIYRFSGKFQGKIVAKRGLRWQLRCMSRRRNILGKTKMLLGSVQAWQDFTFEVKVPSGPECVGQVLRLVHDSRSASEEIISGEVWFKDINLVGVKALN